MLNILLPKSCIQTSKLLKYKLYGILKILLSNNNINCSINLIWLSSLINFLGMVVKASNRSLIKPKLLLLNVELLSNIFSSLINKLIPEFKKILFNSIKLSIEIIFLYIINIIILNNFLLRKCLCSIILFRNI